MPLDPNTYPARSNLVNDLLEGQLKQLFAKLTVPVEFTCIVDGGEKSQEMAALVSPIFRDKAARDTTRTP